MYCPFNHSIIDQLANQVLFGDNVATYVYIVFIQNISGCTWSFCTSKVIIIGDRQVIANIPFLKSLAVIGKTPANASDRQNYSNGQV